MKKFIKLLLSHPRISILLLALLLRLLVFIPVALHPQRVIGLGVDSRDYHFLAVNLAEQGKFSDADTEPYLPESFRTPLYPLFISFIYFIFGQNLAILSFIQVVLSSFICLLIYEIGKMIFNEKIALLAGMLLALNPGLIGYAPVYQSETLFILILLSGIYYLAKYLVKDRKNINLILSAILLGIAALCRAASLFLPLVIIVILLFLKTDFLKKLKASIIFIGFFLLVINIWTVRNYVVFKDFLFSTTGETTLFFIAATEIEADIKNESFFSILEEKIDKYGLEPKDKYGDFFHTKNQPLLVARRKYFLSEALKIMRAHPLTSLKVYLRGRIYVCFLPLHGPILADIWGETGGTGFFAKIKTLPAREVFLRIFKDKNNWLKLLIIFYGAIYMLGVYIGAGLSFTRIERKSLAFFLLLGIAIYFLLISFVGPKLIYPRYRLPMVPFIALLSAIGFLGRRKKK